VKGRLFAQSSFASHALAHRRNVVKVAKDAPLERLGPLGCGIQTGAGAVLNVLKPKAGSSFAVFGAGGVGLAALMGAKIAGCNPIIAVDPVDSRLELARELGATQTINPTREDAVEILTAQGGVDFVIEATGIPAVVESAVKVLKSQGVCGILGVPKPGSTATFDIGHVGGGRVVRGIVEGDADPHQFIPYLVELHQAGKLPIDKLIRYYDLANINQAMADSESGKTVKPVLKVSDV
jgi:aryl-alcohol dehydrogenase